MGADLQTILTAAKAQREAGAWEQAARLYHAANQLDSASPEIKHNLALCHFGMGAMAPAMRFTAEALALKPDLWQSRLIQAKVLRAKGDIEATDAALRTILRHAPTNAAALTALADIEMNEFGDPLSAAARVVPLLRAPETRADAELTILMSKLYDRDESDAELSDALKSFAARELTMPGFRFGPKALAAAPNRSGRPRVGLISPLFCISPVYYFTIGALRALCRKVDLVILNRGTREDRGTRAFRTIAAEWHNVQNLAAPQLADAIKAQGLDILFDLGGWMDPIGLKALSARPAPRLYKWVGGQSATTGLTVFDGFITDPEQSPEGSQSLHTEPLLSLPGGYVTYEPDFRPEDIPVPDAADPEANRFALGVIGNPAKISRAFLAHLEARLDEQPSAELLLVDRRYRHATARNRILDALPPRQRPRLHFRAPTSHREYLAEIRRPAHILDTFPYNGGLTSVEAMYLGKEIEFRSGALFAARHTGSHDFYWRGTGAGRAKLPLRKNYQRLASNLRQLIAPELVGTNSRTANEEY